MAKKTAIASIIAHKQFFLQVDPYEVSWSYNLRTSVTDTYGGKVVQILGVDLGDLTVASVAGKAGYGFAKELYTFFRDASQWQLATGKKITFSFPTKKYNLHVVPKTLSFQDDVSNVVWPYTMSFAIQEDIGGTLTKTAMTKELNALADGVGYTRNEFNYPTTEDEKQLTDALSQAEASSSAQNSTLPTTAASVANGNDPDLSPAQLACAKAIINVAFGLGLSSSDARLAAIIGLMVAQTESTMNLNGDHGDIQNGVATSSLGPFQQQAPWGSAADRQNVTTSAGYFYHGSNGNPGLLSVSGWQTMDPWVAAQKVQQSEFSDGSNYHGNYNFAVNVYNKLATGTTGALNNPSGGGQVQIPNLPDVAPAVVGQYVQAATVAIGNGIQAGFNVIGTPYVYGGGGANGPDDGTARAGSPQLGGTVGFDCSGLTAYVLAQAGFSIPGDSASQAASGKPIAYADKLPGDLFHYPGHISVYVGNYGGQDYILEAPETGKNVRIIAQFRSDYDANLRRYWDGTP